MDMRKLHVSAAKEAEYQQMRRDYAERLGVTVDEMEAYARSISVCFEAGVPATAEQIEAVVRRLGKAK